MTMSGGGSGSEQFDHPCKETCSGWTQGHERGVQDGIKNLVSAMTKLLEPEVMEFIEKSIVRKGLRTGRYEIFADSKVESGK